MIQKSANVGMTVNFVIFISRKYRENKKLKLVTCLQPVVLGATQSGEVRLRYSIFRLGSTNDFSSTSYIRCSFQFAHNFSNIPAKYSSGGVPHDTCEMGVHCFISSITFLIFSYVSQKWRVQLGTRELGCTFKIFCQVLQWWVWLLSTRECRVNFSNFLPCTPLVGGTTRFP